MAEYTKSPSLMISTITVDELLVESVVKDLSFRIKEDTATLIVKDTKSTKVLIQKLNGYEFKQGSRFNPDEVQSFERTKLVKILIDDDKMTQA